ncbi:ArsC family reductase [Pseudomonadota bacterium]
MSQVEIFGIANCDTVKKARKWLKAEGVGYQFHDYKKEGADPLLLKQWCQSEGWETLLNRRGTTWRKLPDEVKNGVDELRAINLMLESPSMIKRPVLIVDDVIEVGFSADRYAKLFKK